MKEKSEDRIPNEVTTYPYIDYIHTLIAKGGDPKLFLDLMLEGRSRKEAPFEITPYDNGAVRIYLATTKPLTVDIYRGRASDPTCRTFAKSYGGVWTRLLQSGFEPKDISIVRDPKLIEDLSRTGKPSLRDRLVF
ncbi:Uncharacterised protein [uncultured archaeon]|nr:Uncharacterised protein [uncultured archaeon]